MGFLIQVIIITFTFFETVDWFPNCATILQSQQQFMSFHFSTFSPTFTVVCLDYSHPSVYKVEPDCSLIFIYMMKNIVNNFYVLIGHLFSLFE